MLRWIWLWNIARRIVHKMAFFLSKVIHGSYSKFFSVVSDLDPLAFRWQTRVMVLRVFRHLHGIEELLNLILVDEKVFKNLWNTLMFFVNMLGVV